LINPHEELACRGRRQAGRIPDLWRGGEERNLEPLRRLHARQEPLPADSPRPVVRALPCSRFHHLGAEHLALKEAGPTPSVQPGNLQPNIADLLRLEGMATLGVAAPLCGLIRQDRPRLPISGALDLVTIGGLVLPGDPAAGKILGLAEIDLPPLRR